MSKPISATQELPPQGSIGVFDSGFGGLNVLREMRKLLPDYNFIYLGDTARAPYGSRSKDAVYQFVEQAVDFLFQQQCELIVLACNTASSEALRRIQQEYLPQRYPDRRVLGVIIPAIEWVAQVNKSQRVGVIATEGTVNSGAFVREFTKASPTIEVFQRSCPLLVPLIEAGDHDSQVTDAVLEECLAPLIKKNINSLILGCTHYSVLSKKIQKIVGPNTCVVSEDKIIADKLENYLLRHPEIEKKLCKKGVLTVYSTDPTKKFEELGAQFLGAPFVTHRAILDQSLY